MQKTLIANLQTVEDIRSWEMGEALLRSVFSVEKLKPQRVATFGEVTTKHGFDVSSLSDCQSHWAKKATMKLDGSNIEIIEDFNWKRKKVAKSKGMVTFPRTSIKNNRISGGLFFESEIKKEIEWAGIFSKWCSVLSPYGAILHPVVNLEKANTRKDQIREYSFHEEVNQNAWSRFSSGIFHCEFRAGELNSVVTGFSNLGWASFFGAKFSAEVDESRISAAGFPVRKVGDGYLVQVTDDIYDVINDFQRFSKRRAELKSLFRKNLFLIKDEP